jgi:TolA-binding protein
MNRLTQFLLLMVALLLFIAWQQQARVDRLTDKLGKTEARAELLASITQELQQSLNRAQQERQQARRLLQERQERLQQADTDTRSKRNAVQQHLATPPPSRPDCSREPLPAAVVSLLGTAATGDYQAGTGTAATGPDAGVP